MDGACCAHLTVRWTEQRIGRGEVRGWWECEDCRQKFTPIPRITVTEPAPVKITVPEPEVCVCGAKPGFCAVHF